jgi:hypothetical protein
MVGERGISGIKTGEQRGKNGRGCLWVNPEGFYQSGLCRESGLLSLEVQVLSSQLVRRSCFPEARMSQGEGVCTLGSGNVTHLFGILCCIQDASCPNSVLPGSRRVAHGAEYTPSKHEALS